MHPYKNLPPTAYWKTAAGSGLSGLAPLWKPKFNIGYGDRIITFGSCFAQHIGRHLFARGFSWLETEPPPPGLHEAQRYSYSVFSCRTGNIYTASMLRQWTQWALADEAPPADVWQQDGRFFDPFRPVVEPGGFATPEEVLHLRGVTVRAFEAAVRSADVLIFTLGLTESWWNRRLGYEYQLCPGTVVGRFDPEEHEGRIADVGQVVEHLDAAIGLMRQANERLRVVLTVSPVPLAATMSGTHVLLATMEAKSILRAAAGQLRRTRDHVDYFPAYDLVASPLAGGFFFEPGSRQVSREGVAFVMEQFHAGLEAAFGPVGRQRDDAGPAAVGPDLQGAEDDVVCEEELLSAFADRP